MEVKDSIGNITYQNEIEVWNRQRNHLQKQIVDFEEKFLAKYDSDIPILKSEKIRAKPVILLQDATGKGSQWSYLERRPPLIGLRLGLMIKIGKVAWAVLGLSEHRAHKFARLE